MFRTNKFSSFMISDILKCDKQDNLQNDLYNQMSSLDNNLLTFEANRRNSYSTNSQIQNYYNWSQTEDKFSAKSLGGREGPTVDTILWQHYLLRQRMLMQAKPRKGGQIRFTGDQSVALEKQFVCQKYLSPPERKKIANELGLTERQIKTWFQNRRAKWRRCKQLTEDSDRESDKHILFNKYEDMTAKSRDIDNNQPFDGYHCNNRLNNKEIELNLRLIQEFT